MTSREHGWTSQPDTDPAGAAAKLMVLLAPWTEVDSLKVAEPEPATKVLLLPALVNASGPLPPMKVLLLPSSRMVEVPGPAPA